MILYLSVAAYLCRIFIEARKRSFQNKIPINFTECQDDLIKSCKIFPENFSSLQEFLLQKILGKDNILKIRKFMQFSKVKRKFSIVSSNAFYSYKKNMRAKLPKGKLKKNSPVPIKFTREFSQVKRKSLRISLRFSMFLQGLGTSVQEYYVELF